MKLLVVTIEKFQDIELVGFLGAFKQSQKLEKITFWNPDNQKEVQGSNQIGVIKTITGEINVEDYDAIFVPGGVACLNLRTNKKALDLIKKFVEQNKWIIAICDAPNAMYENRILSDKNYSSYPIENISKTSGAKRNNEYVSVDGKYITGRCPSASVDLAIKAAEVIFGSETSSQIYNGVYGIERK